MEKTDNITIANVQLRAAYNPEHKDLLQVEFVLPMQAHKDNKPLYEEALELSQALHVQMRKQGYVELTVGTDEDLLTNGVDLTLQSPFMGKGRLFQDFATGLEYVKEAVAHGRVTRNAA